MKAAMIFLALSLGASASVRVAQSEFLDPADGWTRWSQRQEISPVWFVSSEPSRGGPGSLGLSGGANPAASGRWERKVNGVEPGKWYRLTAWYRSKGLTAEENQVLCRLSWTDRAGRGSGRPEYAWESVREGEWTRLTVAAPAPANASSASIELWLTGAPGATVWWDDIHLEETPAPDPRKVSVAAIRYRAKGGKSREENVAAFSRLIEDKTPEGTDLILLPEGMTVVGTRLTYVQAAEPVPGPTTAALGDVARAKKAWIVAGLYERDGVAVYNTAVLIDREGRLAGKYRKVYLPREEVEAGLTPGSEYPVFRTDFGRVGIMICWDVQFPDPARAMALNGADLLLLPIWGGNLTLTRARAIENSVFLATSGYDIASMILDPRGETLATTEENGSVALATLDLNRRYEWEWLGNMKGRFHRETRLDVPVRRNRD